jgi:predicted GTPase
MAIRSQFIKTPGIETYRHYIILQRMIQERIRATLQGDSFADKSLFYATQFLEVPHNYQREEDIKKYIMSEAKEILAAFKKFESSPEYAEDIRLLKQYEGSIFNITSITTSGIQVLIDTEDEKVA